MASTSLEKMGIIHSMFHSEIAGNQASVTSTPSSSVAATMIKASQS